MRISTSRQVVCPLRLRVRPSACYLMPASSGPEATEEGSLKTSGDDLFDFGAVGSTFHRQPPARTPFGIPF